MTKIKYSIITGIITMFTLMGASHKASASAASAQLIPEMQNAQIGESKYFDYTITSINSGMAFPYSYFDTVHIDIDSKLIDPVMTIDHTDIYFPYLGSVTPYRITAKSIKSVGNVAFNVHFNNGASTESDVGYLVVSDPTGPTPATNLAATQVTINSAYAAKVSWTVGINTVNSRIYRTEECYDATTGATTQVNGLLIANTTVNTYTDTTVRLGCGYWYQIVADSASGLQTTDGTYSGKLTIAAPVTTTKGKGKRR